MMYEVKDIILTTPEYGSNTFVILEIIGNQYKVARKNKKYLLLEDQIKAKVGTVKVLPIEDEENHWDWIISKARLLSDDNPLKKKWLLLAILNPNERIAVLHRKVIYEAEFVKINKKPKYVFNAKINGKQYSFSINSLIGRWQKSD